jgi:hypothetical protein
MKKFIGTISMVVTIMCSLLFGISSFILGFRIIQLLISGAINPTLCLEFLVSVILLGVCVALTRIFGESCDVEVGSSDTIVGKHKEDIDEG